MSRHSLLFIQQSVSSLKNWKFCGSIRWAPPVTCRTAFFERKNRVSDSFFEIGPYVLAFFGGRRHRGLDSSRFFCILCFSHSLRVMAYQLFHAVRHCASLHEGHSFKAPLFALERRITAICPGTSSKWRADVKTSSDYCIASWIIST